MKRTDLLRKERELKKARKKAEKIEKEGGSGLESPGDYIKAFSDAYFHDGNKIYNINSDEKILELIEDMKDVLEEKHWEAVFRKSIKKVGVKERDEAFDELKALADL